MKNYKITKEDIFQKTEGGLDIIRYYVPEIDECLRTKKKFKLHEEETPSSSIKKMSDGNYVVADFGDGGRWMNGIALVQDKEKVEYGEAIRIIAERHGIGSSEEIKSMYEAQVSTKDADPDQADGTWIFNPIEEIPENHLRIIFSDKTIAYIEHQYRDVTDKGERKEKVLSHLRKIMLEQHWHGLESYTIIKKRKAITFTASEFYPIFRIEEQPAEGKTFSKIYQPKSKDKSRRFFYHGDFDAQFLHGLKQVKKAYQEYIDEHGEDEDEDKEKGKVVKLPEIFFCTGGSDAMNLKAIGYHVVYPSSEHFKLSKDQLFNLFMMADSVMTCPDLDATGQMQNHRLCLTPTSDLFLDIRTVELPEYLKKHRDQYGRPCKDVRDYLKYYRATDFRNLVKIARMYRFWDYHLAVDRNGKEKIRYGRKLYEYKISMERVLNFLIKVGFGRLKNQMEAMEFVQVEGNQVRKVNIIDIKSYLLNFLRSRFMPEDLINIIHRPQIISSSSFDSLPLLEPDFKDYDEVSQYMFFQNISWKISAKGIEEFANDKVDKMVWEHRILPRKVKLLPPMFNISLTEEGLYDLQVFDDRDMFFRFLMQGSRVHWRKELETNLEGLSEEEKEKYRLENKFTVFGPNLTPEERQDQIHHLCNKIYLFGYMMHRFKNDSRPWVPYPMDDTPNHENDDSNGRSGKSLFVKALGTVKNLLILDGKDENLFKDNHVFEEVTIDTDMILVDDATKDFPMKRTFSLTTGDLKMNPKGTKRVTIPFDLAPKLSITTNFAPDDDSSSAKARIFFTGFSNYYHFDAEKKTFNETRQPIDDFGKQMFKGDYTEEEWNLSMNFMAQCCQLYLSWPHEAIKAPMANITDRTMVNLLGLNFLGWAEVFFSEESGRMDCFIPLQYALDDYISESGVKTLKAHGFGIKMRQFARLKGYEFNPKSELNKDGRLTRNINEFRYDTRERRWINTGRKKTQTMIYLRSDMSTINNRVYDPSTESIEAPQPDEAKPLPF